ncbi:MAG: hypothetical protein M3367_14785 [Acidobacteriota bacterium]|nr:hypothetical protein [Acidobacteriota bacterium]
MIFTPYKLLAPASNFFVKPQLSSTDFSKSLFNTLSSSFGVIAHDSNVTIEMTWGKTADTQVYGTKTT